METKKHFFRIRPTITLLLVLLISSVILVTLSLQYYFSKDLAFDATENSFRLTSEKIEQKIMTFDEINRSLVKSITNFRGILDSPKVNEKHKLLKELTLTLDNNPNVYSIYMGNKDEDFYEIINLDTHTNLRKKYTVSNEVKWLIIKIYTEKDKIRYRYEQFINKNLKLIKTNKKIAKYNPSERPWFKKAFSSNLSVIKTKPYMFSNIDQKGITYAKKIKGTDFVVGLDISLESLSSFLEKQTNQKEEKIILFKKDSLIIASANFDKNIKTIPYPELITFAKNKNIKKLNLNLNIEEESFVYYSKISSDFDEVDHLCIMIPTSTIMEPFIKKIYHSFLITILILTLTIPLIRYSTNILVEPIKKLENENQKIMKREYDEVKIIDTKIKEYHALSVSLSKMSASISDFEQKQQELMDSFIKLIASAIDAKSKYTGGHCERVPILAIELTNAASKCNEGIFKDFELKTKDEKRELEIAAWLHDCGKVTTPEYVVDKATKLETIYNRIHEIRTRFEVIHRDLIISMYENIKAGADETEEENKLIKEQNKLQEEFKLIAKANIGGEFMSDEDIKSIHKISQRKWKKYFDDTIGISKDEESRLENIHSSFPKEENLLNDKQQHIIKRKNFSQEEFDKYNFKVDVPENLYNHGEIYNLTIKKGTLTNEERYKINEHMIMSIKMLEQLPFHQKLQRVPEYAGAHHETLIGTGYPRRLKKEDMSIPARIMAIADIFEALTAADRPYKKAKTLSESINILNFMAKEQHIDKDIFRLFLTSGVYMEYAKKFLHKEQIDTVDISKYL